MKYHSTGGEVSGRSFADVVAEGAAPDGGLYVPDRIPEYDQPESGSPHAEYVARSLEAFGLDGGSALVAEAFSSFNHPEIAPIAQLGNYHLLELFWGPTISFKDHALQVLGRLVDKFLIERGERRTVLVATSGDTGSAAIAGFRGREAVDIVVLYPVGMVSDFQRRQMTTVPDHNVTVLAVRGSFDDCQRMVKEAFRAVEGLASANSINWGRIASQVGYYMSASARLREQFDVVVPTGNFGNAYSASIARRMGASIRSITIATNQNRVLYDLQATGDFEPGTTVATLAPAMDIQIPSNLERFLASNSTADFSSKFGAGWADDETILRTIRSVHEETGTLIDPHTAAAWSVADAMKEPDIPRLVVATAHPAKFAETVERASGVRPKVPEWAAISEGLGERHTEIDPTLDELRRHL